MHFFLHELIMAASNSELHNIFNTPMTCPRHCKQNIALKQCTAVIKAIQCIVKLPPFIILRPFYLDYHLTLRHGTPKVSILVSVLTATSARPVSNNQRPSGTHVKSMQSPSMQKRMHYANLSRFTPLLLLPTNSAVKAI